MYLMYALYVRTWRIWSTIAIYREHFIIIPFKGSAICIPIGEGGVGEANAASFIQLIAFFLISMEILSLHIIKLLLFFARIELSFSF